MEEDKIKPNQPSAPTSAPQSEPTPQPEPTSQPEPTPPPTSTPEPSHDTPKKPKTLVATAITCAILAVAGIGFGIYGMFFHPQPKCETNCDQTSDTTSSTQETTSESSEEVEITDLTVIDDLDKKIAILFNTDSTDRTFNTGMGIGYYGLSLFREGDISESDKVRSVITHALELRPLDEQKVNAAVAQNGYSGETEKLFRESVKGVDGELVAQKYKEIFGKTLVKGEIKEYCGYYKYNKQYDFYYSGIPGCGGRTPYSELYYKYRYSEDDNHAYVYTSTAVISPTIETTPEGYTTEDAPFYVYCDVSYLGDNGIVEDAKVCATLQSYDEKEAFTLNASNYEQYSKYRFVFDKNNDGNYYFNRVEKAQEES